MRAVQTAPACVVLRRGSAHLQLQHVELDDHHRPAVERDGDGLVNVQHVIVLELRLHNRHARRTVRASGLGNIWHHAVEALGPSRGAIGRHRQALEAGDVLAAEVAERGKRPVRPAFAGDELGRALHLPHLLDADAHAPPGRADGCAISTAAVACWHVSSSGGVRRRRGGGRGGGGGGGGGGAATRVLSNSARSEPQ